MPACRTCRSLDMAQKCDQCGELVCSSCVSYHHGLVYICIDCDEDGDFSGNSEFFSDNSDY